MPTTRADDAACERLQVSDQSPSTVNGTANITGDLSCIEQLSEKPSATSPTVEDNDASSGSSYQTRDLTAFEITSIQFVEGSYSKAKWWNKFFSKRTVKQSASLVLVTVMLSLFFFLALRPRNLPAAITPIDNTGSSPEDETANNTTSVTSVVKKILRTVAGNEVRERGSPQSKSAEWILNRQNLTMFQDEDGKILEEKVVQRYALGSIYYSLNGSNWVHPKTNSSSCQWMDGYSECCWNGVSCNGNGTVVQLKLEKLNLTGHIPREAGLLDQLTYLDMFSNSISGKIPLLPRSLVYLNLKANMLEGSIPRHFFSLKSLNFVDLSKNRLTGMLSKGFGKLSRLIEFDISNNLFNGKLPVTIGDMLELQKFDASHNKFWNKIPTEIGRVKTLQFLDVSYNSLQGNIPGELINIPELLVLNLEHNHLNGTLPSVRNNNSVLGAISVNNNQLDGNIPRSFERFANLRKFLAHDNDMIGSVPVELCHNRTWTALSMDCRNNSSKHYVSCSCCTQCH